MHPAKAAGQRCSRQQAASPSWSGPTGRPSNLLCCSMCCVILSGTTTSISLEIFDNHCRTAESFGAMTETGFCASWQQPPYMHQNSLPWCSGCLASKAPATMKVQTQTFVHMYSVVKSQGRQRPTGKYITRMERKKPKPGTTCYNLQSWINHMASEDEPHIVTGSWKTFSQCTDVGKKIANLWGFMRKLHIEDVFKSHFVNGIVSPVLSPSAPFEET